MIAGVDGGPEAEAPATVGFDPCDLYVYENVAVEKFDSESRNFGFVVSMEVPGLRVPVKPKNAKPKGKPKGKPKAQAIPTPADHVRYWEDRGAKRLRYGSLLCFIRNADAHRWPLKNGATQHVQIEFGVVVDRRPSKLVQGFVKGGDNKYRVTVAPLVTTRQARAESAWVEEEALGAASGQPTGTWTVIQTCSGFFLSYLPVLEALQRRAQSAELLPLQQYLCPADNNEPKAGGPPDVGLPAYLASDVEPKLDLSVLAEPSAKHQLRDLIVSSPAHVHQAAVKLTRATTMDLPQSTAVLAALTQEFTLIQGPPGGCGVCILLSRQGVMSRC